MPAPFSALVAQATSAQQTQWQLESNWTWSPWFTVLFVVTTIIGIVYLYTREPSPAGAAYRTMLAALRLTTIALVMVMLSELLFSATRNGLPRLIVLLDHSASMGLEQPSTTSSGGEAYSRLDAARGLLVANSAAWIEQLQEQYVLEFAAVADGVVRLEGETPAEFAEAIKALDTTSAASVYSRLGDAVAYAIDTREGVSPAAVVLATDGRTTAGRSLDEARELARSRGVPIYTIGFGATHAPPDLRLENLLADRSAFKGDLVALAVTIEATDVDGHTAMVRVRDTTIDKVVAEQTVVIKESPLTEQLQLVVHPDREGSITYAIEVEALAGERDTENNRIEHTIEVSDEQVRVLLAASYPSYEFRYLKSLLDRDSSFDLTSFLQEADVEYAQQDSSAIAQLPLESDGLETFDVLVLLDFNTRLIPSAWWANVERHVVEQGGGLVLVAGPRHFPWQYNSSTPVATLSPVELRSAGRPAGVYEEGFNLQLTPLGSESAAMQLGATLSESRSIWHGLPPFYWYAMVDEPKPAARVLAVHPSARTSSGNAMPLIISQYVGAGRVLYHGVDSTWRWRQRVGDVFFARYWGQSLRHLARSKLREGDQSAEILVDRDFYELGQPVRLGLRLAGQEQTTEVELLLTADGEPNRRVKLTPSRALPTQFQTTLSDLPPGRYRVTASTAGLTNPPDAAEFAVVAPPGELADITMNRAGLELLSTATYGKFYTAATAANLLNDLPTGDRVPLEMLPPVEIWNQWWMLAAITGCLTAEWILRKRRAML